MKIIGILEYNEENERCATLNFDEQKVDIWMTMENQLVINNGKGVAIKVTSKDPDVRDNFSICIYDILELKVDSAEKNNIWLRDPKKCEFHNVSSLLKGVLKKYNGTKVCFISDNEGFTIEPDAEATSA